MKRLLVAIPLLLVVGLIALLGLQGLQDGRNPALIDSPLVDVPAPDFTLPPLLETAPGFARSDLLGEVTVVNIFASWCAPCRVEHPILMRLAEQEGVRVFGLAYKDEADAIAAYLEEVGNPFTAIGADLDGQAAIQWGAYGVPETYVIDAGGMIRFRHPGLLTPAHLNQTVLPLIEELRS